MGNFLSSAEFWSNILGGIASALILAAIYWAVNYNKRKNINKLIKIEKQSIELLVDAEEVQYLDRGEFHDMSDSVHKQAIEVAKRVSPSAGALITSVIDVYRGGDSVDHWYPILKEINKRIKIILTAHI